MSGPGLKHRGLVFLGAFVCLALVGATAWALVARKREREERARLEERLRRLLEERADCSKNVDELARLRDGAEELTHELSVDPGARLRRWATMESSLRARLAELRSR